MLHYTDLGNDRCNITNDETGEVERGFRCAKCFEWHPVATYAGSMPSGGLVCSGCFRDYQRQPKEKRMYSPLPMISVPPNFATASLQDVKKVRADQYSLWPYKTPRMALFGESGSGKTHLCYAIIDHLQSNGNRLQYWDTEKLKSHWMQMVRQGGVSGASRLTESLQHPAPLILDDITAAKKTDGWMEYLEAFAKYRHDHSLPTLITSSVLGPKLQEFLDTQTYRRFCDCKRLPVLKKFWTNQS